VQASTIHSSESLISPGLAQQAPSRAAREAQSMNRIAQLLAFWLAPVIFVLFGIGTMWLARFLPPAIHPGDSANTVAAWYMHHQTRIRIGLVMTMLAWGLIAFWGICMAVQTRRKEGLFPALTYAQVIGMAAGCGLLMLQVAFWVTAAWRPGHIPATTTQTFNDAGWMALMGTWLPFVVWCFALGLVPLLDKSDAPVFPRWSGYLSIAVGISFMCGSGVWFASHGPWSWVGLMGLYVPFIGFGVWVIAFSWLSYVNVTRRGWVHTQDLATSE
jgi:hypothetical protein